VSYESFEKLIKNIGEISEEKMFRQKQMEFEKRVERCLNKQERVYYRDLEILLNDDFVNELSFMVKS
jgi:hypothetical protein